MKSKIKKTLLVFCLGMILICIQTNKAYGDMYDNTIYIDTVTNKYKTIISAGQYRNRKDLKRVIIREGITEIHEEAFGSCSNLIDVTLPQTIKYISPYAFWNCNSNITIHGYTGTLAEKFAQNYGDVFIEIKNEEELLPTYLEKNILEAEDKILSRNKSGLTSFSFITDIHAENGTYSPMANINSFNRIGNSGLVQFGMCAGDITTGKYEDLKSGKGLYNIEYLSNKLKQNNSTTLFARGNHDCNTRNDSSVAISGKQYYETVLKELNEDGKINVDKNNTDGDYYYYDLEDRKIRVCVLNAFNGENYEFIFGQNQLNFVANEVLNLSTKDNSQDWQVLFLTHTVDSSKAHLEVPKDNEKLYSIINAFQEGKKYEKDDINIDYSMQGKGTVIAIITGHHHLDTTMIKNNILIITVRSASPLMDRDYLNTEQYNENDISFDVFSIDTENKKLYSTKVGRGKDRQWTYDINNLKEDIIDENYEDISLKIDDYIKIGTMRNQDNQVIAVVTSNIELKQKLNQTWKLSKDKKTYIKLLDDVPDGYTTTFANVNGYTRTYTFKLNELKDKKSPELELKYEKNTDGTVTAKVVSNEILQIKGNTDWKLNENRKEYTYKFVRNTTNYVTAFKDVFGNESKLILNVKIFEPEIEYVNNNDNTITIKAISNIGFANIKPTWNLSEDGCTYTKTYNSNQNYFTTFTSRYGDAVNKNININKFDEKIDVELSYKNNEDGTVTVIAKSKNNKFANTKPTWNLSKDGYTYTKIYNSNQNYYTMFTNEYGNTVNKNININKFDEKIDVELSYKNNEDGTVTVIAKSKNNKFANTKPTWNLSKDGYTYTKIYNSNQNYYTMFTNEYGNTVNKNINI